MITGEKAIEILKSLKESAKIIDAQEFDILEGYRNVVAYEKREIIETLLNLDI